MKAVVAYLAVLVITVKLTSSAKVFSCDQGCKDDSECPSNSHCVAVSQSSDCGMCLCKAGFKTQGTDCVPNKSEKNQKGGGGGGKSKETTAAPTTTAAVKGGGTDNDVVTTSAGDATTSAPVATVSTTASGPTTQGPPPAPKPIDCAEYKCPPVVPNTGGEDNPFRVRSALINESSLPVACRTRLANPGRPCKMGEGGTVCYGIYCLKGDQGTDFCICDYNRVDRQCAVEKPGKCDGATSQVPQSGYKAQNKRFRNKNSPKPDEGPVYGRHFAASFEDCIKLCTWTGGSCRSVNYGTLGGQKVCELLSNAVTKGSILETWLTDAQGWQFATVAP